MRAFVAVNMAENLRHALAQAQQRLRSSGADVKWVQPEGIHITLKFLGWVEDVRIPAVAQVVAAAAESAAPFRLCVEGIGGFPSATAPRVIWAGVREGARELTQLARRIEETLEPLGFAREQREFSAHVTLGRTRSPRQRQGLAALMEQERERSFGEMEVTRVELMRSDLRPTGPIYTSEREFTLGRVHAKEGSDDGGQG